MDLHTADILKVTEEEKYTCILFIERQQCDATILSEFIHTHLTLSHTTSVFRRTVAEKHSLMYAGGLCSVFFFCHLCLFTRVRAACSAGNFASRSAALPVKNQT